MRLDAVNSALAKAMPSTILEVGAGVGAMGVRLAENYDYIGLEPDAVSFSSLQHALAQIGRGRALPGGIEIAPAGMFDLLCAFEVLEHIPDDHSELLRWREHIRPNGFLLLSVPAHQAMFGSIDRLVGHVRRYEREQLQALLSQCGFAIEQFSSVGLGIGHVSHWVGSMLSRSVVERPVDAQHASRMSGRLWRPDGRASAWARHLVALPFRALQRLVADTDLGTGYVVLARRQR
jgi:SAM-dependent methyltransferase